MAQAALRGDERSSFGCYIDDLDHLNFLVFLTPAIRCCTNPESIVAMHIALTCPDAKDAARWAHALQRCFASAKQNVTIDIWPEAIACADFAVVWSPTQAFIDAQQHVKAIFTLGAGVDALLKLRLPAVPVIRIEDGGMGVQMADYVCHAVLRHVRQFDVYEAAMQAGEWRPMRPRMREKFPVGVMGLGVLGAQVARCLHAFGFPVRGWSRSAKEISGVACYVGAAQFNDFLAATRILVCILPLTPETRDIMNHDSLSKLRRDAYVINVARGAHLVEEDLIALIESGHIAGATLDVFRNEPMPEDHPFRAYPQIRLTPHIAAQTWMDESVKQIAAKIGAIERGEPVTGIVDMNKGY
jgi:glyoxylate/hydroxypyruvate reductase A